MRLEFIKWTFFVFAAAALFNSTGDAAEQPNILFIFSDDHAAWAVGAAGDPHAKTPNMDRIYREGATFTNAFTVTPVCSPSRAEMMTGRYGSQLQITDWINPRVEQTMGLDPANPVWPRSLKKAGYRTGLIGKWHLGTEDRFHPIQFGYDYFMGFRAGGNRPQDPTLEINGKVQKITGLLPDILTDDAIDFIQKESAKPFLLSLHYRAPHAPWLPVADSDWAPYESIDPKIPNPDYPNLDVKLVKRKTKEYLASVTSVDRNIGRLLEELDQLNLSENTIVIYSSDHGYNMGHNGIWHKGNGHWILTEFPPATENIPQRQRPNMYDHSLRVPLAIRYPAMIKPGTKIDQTVTNLDWFASLLDLADVEVPEVATQYGRSFAPLLKGEKMSDWEDDLYAEYSTHHQSSTHMRMYRTSEWKLIRDFLNPERDELYYIAEDPQETKNLIASTDPEVVAIKEDLHQQILERMKTIGDPVLETVK
ncbi:Choline-sulfatase [Polystyrenella longa]|uniref:Choline-sulfatase n=1 Tax=Polystyrenella longa TaxID=2528007 RepID=A0A518CR22_9PLAN|nr:sulfatase-like hydrolase/transferase [Polystyrenella longa]QDU81654.1 Choline-sulfatase [Polystyrenella longa]